MDYDLVVIGGGAGGMAAARAGVRRNKRTLLVQDGPIGGDCTFAGCIPSKALIAAAGRGDGFDEAMASVRRAVATVAATEDAEVFREEGIDVREGRATFVDEDEVEVDGIRLAAHRFVVATGSGPIVPPVPGLAEAEPLTSDDLWSLPALPSSLLVLGGGAIGCELAQAFARLGSRVTVVEALDRLLAGQEPEVSAVLSDVFRREGIDVRTGAKVKAVTAAGVELEDGALVRADRILVATGRRAATGGLHPEVAGIELDDDGNVRTDEYLHTTAPRVWAVGDVTGRMSFTHAADEMGRIAVGNAFGGFRQRRFHADRTPAATFTAPEVGRVGLTEAQAAEQVPGSMVSFLPLAEVDRAIAEGARDGFVKIITGPRWWCGGLAGGRVLGATVMAPRGGDLVSELALAMATGMFPARLALATRAYPSWSTGIQKAMGQLFLEIEGRRAEPARADGMLRS